MADTTRDKLAAALRGNNPNQERDRRERTAKQAKAVQDEITDRARQIAQDRSIGMGRALQIAEKEHRDAIDAKHKEQEKQRDLEHLKREAEKTHKDADIVREATEKRASTPVDIYHGQYRPRNS